MEWACSFCTFLNKPDFLQCGMCGETKQKSRIPQRRPNPPSPTKPKPLPIPNPPATSSLPILLPLHQPSKSYLNILNSVKSLSFYVDPTFPPSSTIIDGRSGDASKKAPTCLCGKTSQLKTTQSEKNYGRLYATCHFNSTWR